ncbi:MAG: cellulase family glycosylhydrolase [Solirubrobacterales bacterium]|nr:cellulase family glycosylhydrolase [Solirubrobacterales bacterium]
MPKRFRRILALFAGLIAAGGAMVAFAPLSAAQRPSRARSAAGTVGPSPIVGLIDGAAQWRQDTGMTHRMNQVLATSDAKWVREGFYWSQIEPKPGVFNFAHYDQFVTLAAERGVHVFVELYTAPRWAAPTPTSVPADPTAYAAFVAAVVARYAPGGTFWASHPNLDSSTVQTFEIWHEAYYSNGNDGHYDPGRYARLVQAAVTAGRAANPNARFLMGAEMQGQFVGSGPRRAWVWWVDALYKAVPDLNNYFDGVSVHPYGHDITHRSPAIPDQPYYGSDQMRRIEIIRQQFVAHGAAAKPFWATEVGWPTCKRGTVRCVSPAGQRKSFVTLMRYAETTWKSYVRAVFVYYYDDLGRNSANPNNDYGLIYYNHKPKLVLPAFEAFARLSPTTSPWP